MKSLIATSNFYKIRLDISSAHKNRSFFKKVFLKPQSSNKTVSTISTVPNPFILQTAIAY